MPNQVELGQYPSKPGKKWWKDKIWHRGPGTCQESQKKSPPSGRWEHPQIYNGGRGTFFYNFIVDPQVSYGMKKIRISQ